MMKVITENSWNEEFFNKFLSFKNDIHKEIVTSFPETLDDYSKFFAPTSVFMKDFSWQAFTVEDDKVVLAQGILCWKRNSKLATLGFLDWINNEEAGKLLVESIRTFGKAQGLQSMKAPVDMNFFIKYRIRSPGGEKPFYGEPVYPDYYHDLYRAVGFKIAGEWDTYKVNRIAGIKDFFKKRKKLAKKEDGGHPKSHDPKLKTTIRGIRMNKWEEELKIIYDLFSEAYRTMPEFESITFEQFKIVYDDFKYIIHPWLSYIVELQGRPVAFSINFVDPLPVLAPLKGKKLNALQKALVLAKLRLNNGTYMIAHVGKIPGPNGEEIKGVQYQVSRRISFWVLLMKEVIVSFQNVDSPSRRSWNPEVQIPYAHYVLYGMEF